MINTKGPSHLKGFKRFDPHVSFVNAFRCGVLAQLLIHEHFGDMDCVLLGTIS